MNQRKRLNTNPENRKVMIAIIASVVVIAAVVGVVLFTTGDASAYSQKLKVAEQYVAEGDLDAAELQYKELIALNPKRETAYIELANEVYLKQDRYSEAYEILELGQKNTGKDRVFKKAIEQVQEQQKESSVWKAAYREVLEQNADDIISYEYPEYGDPREGTALCDLNGDGVAELLFFTAVSFEVETMHIYTYQDGKARELFYDWDNGLTDGAEGPTDRMLIAQVAGGADYVVYTEKGQKGFTTYSNITDEEIQCTTNRYEMDASCNINQISLLGMGYAFVDFDNNGKYGPDYATYYKDYKKCSREEYNEIMDPSIENVETVIFRFIDGGDTDDIDETKYDDHPALWKKTKGKAISQFYEDMIEKLSEAPVEETPENKSLKDTEYTKMISGGLTREEIESELALATATGHERYEGNDITRAQLEECLNGYYGAMIVHYTEVSKNYSVDGHAYVIPLKDINRHCAFFGFAPYEANKTYSGDEGNRCWTNDTTLYIEVAWGDSFIRSSAKITEAEQSGDSLRIKYDFSASYDPNQNETEEGTYIANFKKTSDGKYVLDNIEED